MKLILITLVLIGTFSLGYAREEIKKIGTRSSEISTGMQDDWHIITIFYNKKPYTVSLKPGSKVDILRDYIGIKFHTSPDLLDVSISEMKEEHPTTRQRKIHREKRILTAEELNMPIDKFEATVFTVNVYEETS